MYEWFANLASVNQSLIGTLFTWGMTALGALLVFTTKNVNQKFLDSMLGFAGGVMIAASYWSLLSPALEMSEGKTLPSWMPACARICGSRKARLRPLSALGSRSTGNCNIADFLVILLP